MPYINDKESKTSIAGLAILYDKLLDENLKLRQDRLDLKQENSFQAGRINSLETEVDKLKKIIKDLGGSIE